MNTNPFNVERYVQAQSAVQDDVLIELERGHKTTHWMRFVFPQLRALERSVTAHLYGITGRAEAIAYLQHPVLGPRLFECVDQLMALTLTNPHAIFGSPDDVKLRSCLTLFSAVADEAYKSRLPEAADASVVNRSGLFQAALERFYPQGADADTLTLLASSAR